MGQKGYRGRQVVERNQPIVAQLDNKPKGPDQMLYTALFERILKACIAAKTGLPLTEVNHQWSGLHAIEKIHFPYFREIPHREEIYFRHAPGGAVYEITGSICNPLDGQIVRQTTVLVAPSLENDKKYKFKAVWTETFSGWIVSAEVDDAGAGEITLPQPAEINRKEIQGYLVKKKKFPVGTVTWNLKTISNRVWEPAICMSECPEETHTVTSNGTTDVEDAVYALLSARSCTGEELELFPAYDEAYAQELAKDLGGDFFAGHWRRSTPFEMRKVEDDVPDKFKIPRADRPFPEGWNAHDRLKELQKIKAAKKKADKKEDEAGRAAKGRQVSLFKYSPSFSYSTVAQGNVAIPANPQVRSVVYTTPEPAPVPPLPAQNTRAQISTTPAKSGATPANAGSSKPAGPAQPTASGPANTPTSAAQKVRASRAPKVKAPKPGTMAYYSSAARVQATAPKVAADAKPRGPQPPKDAAPGSTLVNPAVSVKPAGQVAGVTPAEKLPERPVLVAAAAPPKQIFSYSTATRTDLPTAPADPKVMSVVHAQPVVESTPAPPKVEQPAAQTTPLGPNSAKTVNKKPVKVTDPSTSEALKTAAPATVKVAPKAPKVKPPKPGTMAYYSTAAAVERSKQKTAQKANTDPIKVPKAAAPGTKVAATTTIVELDKAVAKPVATESVLKPATQPPAQALNSSTTQQAAVKNVFVPIMSGALQTFVPTRDESEIIQARQVRDGKVEEVEVGMVYKTTNKTQKKKAKTQEPKAEKPEDVTKSVDKVTTKIKEDAPATNKISGAAALIQPADTISGVFDKSATAAETTEVKKAPKEQKEQKVKQQKATTTAEKLPLEMKKASVFLQVILQITRGNCSVTINDWLNYIAPIAAEKQAEKEAKAAEAFATKKTAVRSRPAPVPEQAEGELFETADRGDILADIDWFCPTTNLSRPRGHSSASRGSRTSDDVATQALRREGRGRCCSASAALPDLQALFPLKVAVEEQPADEPLDILITAESCDTSPTTCMALVPCCDIQAVLQTSAVVEVSQQPTTPVAITCSAETIEELIMDRPRQASLTSSESSELGAPSPTTPKFSTEMTLGVGEMSETDTAEIMEDIAKSTEPVAVEVVDCTYERFNSLHGIEYGTINFGLTSDCPVEAIIQAAKETKAAETRMKESTFLPLTPPLKRQRTVADQTQNAGEARMLEKLKKLVAVETFAPGELFKAIRELAAETSVSGDLPHSQDEPEETSMISEPSELSPVRTIAVSEPEALAEPLEETVTIAPTEKDLTVIQAIMDAEQKVCGNSNGCGWTVVGVQVTPKFVLSPQA